MELPVMLILLIAMLDPAKGLARESLNEFMNFTVQTEIQPDKLFPYLSSNTVDSPQNSSIKHDDVTHSLCTMKVEQESVLYFKGLLELTDPHFINLRLKFNKGHQRWSETPETFMGDRWVWTYRAPVGLYPYLSVSIDYDVLSFGMLSYKMIKKEIVINVNVSEKCNITFGTSSITNNIGEALKELNQYLGNNGSAISLYTESYYCFLAEVPGIRETFQYKASLYFIYPIDFFNYNCCITHYEYADGNFKVTCLNEQITKWAESILLPFIFSVILFLYSPLLLWRILCWIEHDSIDDDTWVEIQYPTKRPNREEAWNLIRDWVFLDGQCPYSFLHLLSHVWCGYDRKNPVLVSRIKRFLLLLLLPIGLYIQLLTYHYGFSKERLDESIRHKCPVGFLALLGSDNVDITQSFAPALGGPVYVLAMYYIIGFVLLVVPGSLKQVFINGMPVNSKLLRSPLRFNIETIHRLSKLHCTPNSHKTYSVYTNCLLMLFSDTFWVEVWDIQKSRFSVREPTTGNVRFGNLLFAPFYVVLCCVEVLLSMILYGIPFAFFVTVFVRGIRSYLYSIKNHMKTCSHKYVIIRTFVLENPISDFCIVILVTAILLLFSYAAVVICIESLTYVFSVVVFSFIAVIVFPSINFAIIFFVILCIFHAFRLIRKFGDCYTELLSKAVSISETVESGTDHVECLNNTLAVYSIKSHHEIKSIRVNNRTMPLKHDILYAIFTKARRSPRVKFYKDTYGIPRELFNFLVLKYYPVHRQFLSVITRLILIATLMGAAIAIVRKFQSDSFSEISEVMHVMFVLTVGAIPGLLDKALTTTKKALSRDIEFRRLKRLIAGYWLNQAYQEEPPL